MQMGGAGGAQQQWRTCPRCRQRNPKEGPNNHIVCGSTLFGPGWSVWLAEAVSARLFQHLRVQCCWAGQSKSVWLLKLCRRVCRCWNCFNGFCFLCGKFLEKGKVAKHFQSPSPCRQHS